MSNNRITERVQVVVIGGGQAGLSVGYCLARRGTSFVILEANPRPGYASDTFDTSGKPRV